MDPTESTDFDFFDTPRNQKPIASDDEQDKNNSRSQNSESTENRSNSDDVRNIKNTREKRQSLSSLSESSAGDDDYSSDSVSSLSDNDQSGKTQTKQSQSDRSYSSGSSVSSSYSDRRREGKKYGKNKPRGRSDSRSDESSDDDFSKSKNSTSGSSNNTDRKLKSRIGYRDNKKSITKNLSKSKEKEEDCSSSAYSDGEESSSRFVESPSEYKNKRNKTKSGSKRQEAWGTESSSSKMYSKERPKTAKHRKEHNGSGGGRRKHSPQNSDSEALSDSDITDVSPIESPRSNGNRSRLGAAGDGENSKARFKALPLNGREIEDLDESQVDSTGIDLNILMKAVGELEKKKRVEANSRRVMFAPMTLKRNDKSNYTFDKDRTHDIDRENDRLLKEIVKQVHADRKKQYFKSPTAPKTKITPSAINREREMRRIESENINFLKRLQKVKATSTISRTNQLKEYENTKLHGIPIATLHPVSRASSRTSQFTDSYSSIGSRTRSMTSLHSIASTVRSTTSSKRSNRPSSATKRAESRPEWNDRW